MIYAGETARFQVSLEDDDGKPVSPLPASVTFEVVKQADGAEVEAATAMVLVVEEKGTSTAGTATTLTFAGKNWRPNQWKDYAVRIVGGGASGQERRILSNTADTLTIDSGQVVNEAPVGVLSPAGGVGEVVEIHRARYRKSWAVPTAQEGVPLFVVFRATATEYTAIEKLPFTPEA